VVVMLFEVAVFVIALACLPAALVMLAAVWQAVRDVVVVAAIGAAVISGGAVAAATILARWEDGVTFGIWVIGAILLSFVWQSHRDRGQRCLRAGCRNWADGWGQRWCVVHRDRGFSIRLPPAPASRW
jgi:hypothetical protein